MKQTSYVIDNFDRINRWYGEMKHDAVNPSGTMPDSHNINDYYFYLSTMSQKSIRTQFSLEIFYYKLCNKSKFRNKSKISSLENLKIFYQRRNIMADML